MERTHEEVHNYLLDALADADRALLEKHLATYSLEAGDVLFESGQEVVNVFFPGRGTVASFLLDLRDGVTTEAAMIGPEGAVGGVISDGYKPAFARGTVQAAGYAIRIASEALEEAKQRSPNLRDHFARYSDCLLAQVLQSVACNAVHDFDARLARWLLATQDRLGSEQLPVTQQFVSEMLGVQRTYTTKVVGQLERIGAIKNGRGMIMIADRGILERKACECYSELRRHFEKLLPDVYPPARSH